MIVNDSGLVCPSERSCNACAGAQSARTVIFKRLIPAKRRRTDTGPIYGYNCALSHLIGKLRISNPDRCFSSEFGFNAAFSPKSVKGCSKYCGLYFIMIKDASLVLLNWKEQNENKILDPNTKEFWRIIFIGEFHIGRLNKWSYSTQNRALQR